MNKTICVCGGSGYIGFHTVLQIIEIYKEYNVIIIDKDPPKKHIKKICQENNIDYYQFEICYKNYQKIENIFSKNKIDTVMYFCGSTSVGESVKKPIKYYENNFVTTLLLLKIMKKYESKYLIFSSTAAIFGIPPNIPIKSNEKTNPINPYGQSKLMVETMLKSFDKTSTKIKFVCLRYFNACGAHKKGLHGELHDPETHLIPIILQVAQGTRKNIKIFGSNYNTKDGTCVRDYIHVTDLAEAHILAIKYLEKGGKSDCFNLGSGKGFSVKEIIESCRKVTGHKIPTIQSSRREGDPPILIASSEKAKKVLGWKIEFNSINEIISTQWKFIKKN